MYRKNKLKALPEAAKKVTHSHPNHYSLYCSDQGYLWQKGRQQGAMEDLRKIVELPSYQ